MHWSFPEMIRLFSDEYRSSMLSEGNFGVERESQRVNYSGDLALTPHPSVFGDKFENPRITTDFSESQIEMITPPLKSAEEVYKALNDINNEVKNALKGELLWPLSMPPRLPKEEDIPVAQFPDTEDGRQKQIYRNGLALRYGKKMQMISGIHYNFSFSDKMIDFIYRQLRIEKTKRQFIDEMYFSLTRNFLRYHWILIYLFGASPICDSTYNSVIFKELEKIEKCCPHCAGKIKNFNRYATSLRVSRFGYSDTDEKKYTVYFNSLREYETKIKKMMETESNKYSKLGIYKDGVQIQLNGNLLQSESEFYAPIRFKRNIKKGETQLTALVNRGVEYIEIRILDVNPFDKVGISVEQMNFLQVFNVFCLFEESKSIDEEQMERINTNHQLAALLGRNEDLMLYKYNDDSRIPLKNFGDEIFEKLRIVAKLMDKDNVEKKYSESVESEYKKLHNIELLPSERICREMDNDNRSYIQFGMEYAEA
ncbi:glutamate--cysteine ligase [Clostridium acetobutylicum]|uniref:Glutamate--cysteine ligase n=1 Tax=Clostridium acetobutylicum (strain ATCC 824 / DSM 792 / JCM 1419 / IAM 19013 / LMG 5710 / NBRC 13948 / NRRL B-527 / VKM B-1787 / 2291 / W) TaxID=272562 RepID=GSH1_CLOAB|nr:MULTISPECIES: glutamate--cysteine ligase [Clostridium]Q97IV1.1 RecName: Full=Glutamate--cysteine ligase; AltName: Full=Gamma-ECS; Short=GCS; AltName: Full=Gamma-glutamylcysteine synthetase [Clostridium acetobutylicum ATCC 824]AAK79506.1 Gamma-glutamylcysteine synthetase [Clostridium acetobutylicum ATCC 824]ADZ20591.1 Gamma-glutamylcysteine synthetase [Clostridium acetobutylicum EA 2018]AEI33884.1 gamma-glutamylcysteine synthetase [Clostridium acetobutylicum DSM 1731]AWV81248.1 glutamate--cy